MNKYPQLDLARSLAALFVFFNHLRYIIFLGFHQQQLSVAGKIFYYLTGFGHQSVMIFFVLSGFFITKSIVDSVEREQWSPRRYAIQRLTRLWVVLIPALMLTFLVDTLAWNLFHYNESPGRTSFVVFLQNVFFLQYFTAPTFGSNLALWSLGNEFWYYVMLPFLLLPFLIKKNRIKMIACSIPALAAGIWVVSHLFVGFYGFIIFLMGSLVYIITRKERNTIPQWTFYLSVIVFITILTLTRTALYYYPMLADMLLGSSFAILAYTWLRTKSILTDKYQASSRFVSNFSFTLYVVHVPLMIFFAAMFQLSAEYFTFNIMVYYCLLAVIILLLSWLFYWLFERNTFTVRKFMEKRLL